MKNKSAFYFLGLLTIAVSACYDSIPKSNAIMSRSKTESVSNKVYLGDYEIVYLEGTSKFKELDSLDCWSEFAATTENDFFFFPKRKKLAFQNFFLRTNNKTCDSGYNASYKTTIDGSWDRISCIQEPNLGFYFQLNKGVKIDSIRIKLNKGLDSCIYILRKI